jgi:hypothetical protein
MLLNIIIDDYSMNLEVPEDYLGQQADRFDRLDREMDAGLQLGREWVEHPSPQQRCQSAAAKLLLAIEGHDEALARLAAGYILARLPGVRGVRIDTNGEPAETRMQF